MPIRIDDEAGSEVDGRPHSQIVIFDPVTIIDSREHETIDTGPADGRTVPWRHWIVEALLAATVAAVVVVTSGDHWFGNDIWPLMNRDLSFDGLNRSHGGHWLLPTLLTLKVLNATAGLDFHPWYLLPRSVLLVGVALGYWRLLRARGTDPTLAAIAGMLPVAMATTSWMGVVPIGHAVVFLCALGVGALVERGHLDSNPHRLGIAALLTLGLASTASGPSLWAGFAALTLVNRSIRTYWPALATSAGVYLLWYTRYAETGGPAQPSVPTLDYVVGEAPKTFFQTIGRGMTSTFLIGPQWGWVAAALAGMALLAFVRAWWSAAKGHVLIEPLLLLTGMAALASAVLVRGPQGTTVWSPQRLWLTSVYLVLPLMAAALPRLSINVVRTSGRHLVASVLLLGFVGLQLHALVERIDRREESLVRIRDRVETAAWALHRGEPSVAYAPIERQASVGVIAPFVAAEGWEGRRSDDPAIVNDVLAAMRMPDTGTGSPGTGGPEVEGATVDEEGCVEAGSGTGLTFTLTPSTRLSFDGAEGTLFRLVWNDGRSTVDRLLELRASPRHVSFARPTLDPTSITIEHVDGRPTTICGFGPGRDN